MEAGEAEAVPAGHVLQKLLPVLGCARPMAHWSQIELPLT
jgi:hypothetical protein